MLFSKNYTYPVVARVRRSLLDTLVKGIHVYIESPGLAWDKVVGSSKIGASFGLHIRNILDLKLSKWKLTSVSLKQGVKTPVYCQ